MYFSAMHHEQYMSRCLDLAANAWPECRPNPMVGALLVHDGEVVGEGYTSQYGGNHAEVNAIAGVDEEVLKESTLYVSLEPCAHHGKTPPCADLIVRKSIPRVVVGCRDPFDAVNGKGIERLLSAGIEVIEGVLEKECRDLNKRFFTFHEKKRPYVILKWAESQDGFIDKHRTDGGSAKISGAMMNQQVHAWRSEEQAILVGGVTARKDNPSLTTRLVAGPNPEPYVWTKTALSQDLKLSKWGHKQLNVNSVGEVLDVLFQDGVQSVIIEGGAKVLEQFIEQEAYDEIRRIIGNVQLHEGVKAPVLHATWDSEESIGKDKLLCYINSL